MAMLNKFGIGGMSWDLLCIVYIGGIQLGYVGFIVFNLGWWDSMEFDCV